MKAPDEILQSIRSGDEEAEATEELSPLKKFHVDVTDPRGKRYVGDFLYKVPSLGDQIMVGRLKAEYLPQGGVSDPNATALVEQICYLEVCLQFSESMPKPEWWEPFNLYHALPVSTLYAEVTRYEAKFHGADLGSEEDPKASGEEANGGGPAAPGPTHVGRKIRPTTERREVISADPPRGG
jgi:hypothetical protein